MPDECERHESLESEHRGDEVGGRVVLDDDEQAQVVDGAVVVARRRQPYGRPLLPRTMLIVVRRREEKWHVPTDVPAGALVQGGADMPSHQSHVLAM